MQTPQKYKLVCKKGTTFRKNFSFYDEYRNEISFAGYTARMQVRQDFDSTTPLVSLTTGNGGIAITDNVLDLFIADSVTDDFEVGSYRYDLELIAPNGDVECPLYGTFKVSDEITR